jgi:hypothetical protein
LIPVEVITAFELVDYGIHTMHIRGIGSAFVTLSAHQMPSTQDKGIDLTCNP